MAINPVSTAGPHINELKSAWSAACPKTMASIPVVMHINKIHDLGFVASLDIQAHIPVASTVPP